MKNIDIASQLASLGIAPEVQSAYVIAAVARVIAYTAPLPAAPDAEFFSTTVAPTIPQALDAFNESVPVDYDRVIQLVRQLWEVRYSILHPSGAARSWSGLDLVANELGVDFGVLRTDPALAILTNALAE